MNLDAKIRVLHVFGELNKGGAESRTMDIYRQIDRTQVQFDFAIHSEQTGAFESEIMALGGVIYHGIPRFSPLHVSAYYRRWVELLSQHPYEIIHIHTTNSAVPIALAARKCGVHTVIAHARQAAESSWVRQLFAILQRQVLCRVTTNQLAVSRAAGNFIFGNKSHFLVIPNAIRILDYTYSEVCRKTVRAELGLEGCFVIAMVGRFTPVKNHLFLIDAFVALARRFAQSRLLLIGDGELRVTIEERIAKLEISQQVICTGVRSDLYRLLQAADLFVMPSVFEGMPGSALEAQAAGLPCLLSEKITRECCVLQDRVSYLPIDIFAIWTQKMEQSLHESRPNRNTIELMRKAGFDIKEVAQWYQDFYCSRK